MLIKTQSSSVMATVVLFNIVLTPVCVIAHEVALSVVTRECGHVVRVWARVHVCWYTYIHNYIYIGLC